MKIGIDISQMAYQRTGVANYLGKLVEHLLDTNSEHEYILFYSGLRRKLPREKEQLFLHKKNVSLKKYPFPPKLLNIMWNTMHVLPIEQFIGEVDVFITSDWTEPPVRKAKKATVLYDLIVFLYPEETDAGIIAVQKRKLEWVKQECDAVFCISESTRQDAEKFLNIPKEKLHVIYPGFSL